MALLRGSLRPRPLTVGGVVDALGSAEHAQRGGRGLAPLIAPEARLEVVAEGLEGSLTAPLWRHDPALGRGYLLFSQVDRNRLWRWEEGGGAFTIGRSLFLDLAGCHPSVLRALHRGVPSGVPGGVPGGGGGTGGGGVAPTSCVGMAGGGAVSLGLAAAFDSCGGGGGGPAPLLVAEGGNRRVVRVEADGSRTVLASRPLVAGGVGSAALAPDGTALFFTALPPHPPHGGDRSGGGESESESEGHLDTAWLMRVAMPVPGATDDGGGGGGGGGPAVRVGVLGSARAGGLAVSGDVLLCGDSDGGGAGGGDSGGARRPVLRAFNLTAALELPAGASAGPTSAYSPLVSSRVFAVLGGDAGAGVGGGSGGVEAGDGIANDVDVGEGVGVGGVAVDLAGNVFVALGTGGGVAVLDAEGRRRGTIDAGGGGDGAFASTGVAVGDDGFLYVTAGSPGAGSSVLRVASRAQPRCK